MAELVTTERRDGALVLRLAGERGNALNRSMIEALIAAFRDARADDTVTGVLLTSAHPRIFCGGLDLMEVRAFDRYAMRGFMERFCHLVQKLFAFPKPLVVGISGHAVAGGFVLTLCGDLRILRRGGIRVGFNEGKVGVPYPWTVVQLLRATLRPEVIARVVQLGLDHTDEDAVSLGIVHELSDEDAFEETCLSRLAALQSRELASFAITKEWLRSIPLTAMGEGDPERLTQFVNAWFSDGVQRRIDAVMATLKR